MRIRIINKQFFVLIVIETSIKRMGCHKVKNQIEKNKYIHNFLKILINKLNKKHF